MIAAWFISDLHLKDINERSGNVLLRFLHSLDSGERPVTHLFLLGDIFDLWVGNHQYFYHKFQPIVDMLVKLRHKGVEIQYFEGNHDMHVVDFWQGHLGIPCSVEAKYVRVGALTLRLEHGDLINLSDEKYLKYRAFMRAPLMESLARFLPGKVIDAIGEMASKKSRKHSSQYRENREAELRGMIRAHALRSYEEIPFDAIITGHMHIIDDYVFEESGREVRSLNLGSWFDQPQTLSLIEGKFEWVPLT